MEQSSLSEIKLQFNNEVIKMQPFILQAKTQTINGLSKKIKMLKNRKGTDEQKEKNKRKAESLVSEIMLIKAMKRNDLGRFAICNVENVDKIINTPIVSKERAMARVLSHKSIKQRFLDLKSKHSDVPTARLLEQDPKKVNRKKRKEKLKKKKNDPNIVRNESQSDSDLTKSKDAGESDCSVNDHVEKDENTLKLHKKEKKLKRIISTSNFKVESVELNTSILESRKVLNKKRKRSSSVESSSDKALSESEDLSENEASQSENESHQEDEVSENESYQEDEVSENESSQEDEIEFENPKLKLDESAKKDQDPIKASNLNKQKTLKKKREFIPKMNLIDSNELPSDFPVEKRVDSFFMTDIGSNYMTMAIPRPADKLVKDNDEKTYGMTKNRKMRRAALFGNEVILTDKFKNKNRFDRSKNEDNNRFINQVNQKGRNGSGDDLKSNLKPQNRIDFKNDASKAPLPDTKVEKLHPSWQAKKQQSTILPFQGNKIVFD